MSLSVSITVSKNAQSLAPLISLGFGADIDDVLATEDAEKPISGGVFTMKKNDEPFVYTYKYHELKIILEGTIVLEDRETGIKITGTPGDVIRINRGTTVTFSSPDAGKAFYVGQRALRDF